MKIGFIGSGNMSEAIVRGILGNSSIKAEDIIMSNRSMEKLEILKGDLNIDVTLDNKEVARISDVIVLGVKPNVYKDVIEEITSYIKEECIIITLAPNYKLKDIEMFFDRDIKVVRTMPNTPAMVSAGMTAMCVNENIDEKEKNLVKDILSGFGKVEIVGEYMMEAVVAVSGSSPAYIFILIEAMADGAVAEGMPRDQAYTFAAQAVMGSAKMVLDTKMHPGKLKDMVCSPGGTTIEAVKTLEKNGFRSAILEAMRVCSEKCRDM